MDDEFKLCWKNFQDNIASGFQNLYDRGDLVDVTLACDGKLLHAHKFVLAICSPYFQEIFITNPCKHPTIILKDVSFNIMCELLEFMYQGVVNVKHTELQSFMKVGQQLQIKGLATNPTASPGSTSSEKTNSQAQQSEDGPNANDDTTNGNKNETTKSEKTLNADGSKASPATSPLPINFNSSALTMFKNTGNTSTPTLHHGTKRHLDLNSDAFSMYARKQFRRSIGAHHHHHHHVHGHGNGNNDGNDGGDGNLEHGSNEDFFLPIPHVSMSEARFNIKSDNEHHGSASTSAASLRNAFGPGFNLDYNFYKNNANSANNSAEYPNELYMPNDYSKNFGNHMEIPPNGSSMVMLSSTSLLHGSCVFNRNNTVATQQGMKTYWLCKSYRISMCRARCITHQGRVISATGAHNHPPHMNGRNNNGGSGGAGAGTGNSGSGNNNNNNTTSNLSSGGYSANDNSQQTQQEQQQQQQDEQQQQSGQNNNNAKSNVQQQGTQDITTNNDSGLNVPTGLRGGTNSNNNNNTNNNIFQHNMHTANNEQHQHSPASAPTTTSASSLSSSAQQHLPPHGLPNLMGSHHHQSMGMGANISHLQHNMMNHPGMLPLSSFPPMLTNPMHHHSPQLRPHESNLEITSIRSTESAGSNNQTHHSVNTIDSPIQLGGVASNSPANDKQQQQHVRDDMQQHMSNEHQMMVHNAADLNVGGIERGDVGAQESLRRAAEAHHHHHSHVIESLTIPPPIAPGEHWFQGKLEFMLSQRGKPLLVHDGHTFGIQYVRKDKKYWQCNLSRKFNCKARVTTTDTGEIIVTNNEHCHTEIRQHLRKDYQRNKVVMNALLNFSNTRLASEENLRRQSTHLDTLRRDLQNIVQHGNLAALPLVTHDGTGNEQSSDMDTPPFQRYAHNSSAGDNNEYDDIDDEAPLDCGIRSSNSSTSNAMDILKKSIMPAAANLSNKSNTSNNNNNVNCISNDNSNGNNYMREDWKCKTETSNV